MRMIPPPAIVAAGNLVDRWHEIGPELWFAAGGAAALWVVVLVVGTMVTEPHRVTSGPPTLDAGGAEPPAVVNLLANDWELGRQALPATLLDLAARRFVSIDWIGERTLVRVRPNGPDPGELTIYERLVLDHIRDLSRETTDGFVPGDALTTGPEAVAASWWKRFEKGVVSDARARELSRARWGSGARTVLTSAAVLVGLTVAIAATTLTGTRSDDNPIGAAAGMGLMSAALLITVGSRLGGERDTPAGRDAAARWLGLRAMLANDPMFAEQPPAAVAIWDRLMSYGAALGVARVAVETLPLGAESEHRAWSPVGGRWRIVKIRYPHRLPPGYGRHPGLVALVGLAVTAAGVFVAPAAVSVAHDLLGSIGDVANDRAGPLALRLGVGLVLAGVVLGGVLIALGGAGMFLSGIADLVRGRVTVEGRMLRLRRRGDDQHPRWYLAVDDGSADHIRAWCLTSEPSARQGATVRARVSPWLHHVVDLSTIHDDLSQPASTSASVATAGSAGGDAVTAGPPPALPDAATMTTALGFPVTLAPAAVPHPLAIDGASATYVTADGGRIITAWILPSEIDELRGGPEAMTVPMTGLGDEAYRVPLGGGLVERIGGHALMVVATLPALSESQRDHAVDAVARVTAAQIATR
jgi:hypothetical protein